MERGKGEGRREMGEGWRDKGEEGSFLVPVVILISWDLLF